MIEFVDASQEVKGAGVEDIKCDAQKKGQRPRRCALTKPSKKGMDDLSSCL